jgi:hypothetical protein
MNDLLILSAAFWVFYALYVIALPPEPPNKL